MALFLLITSIQPAVIRIFSSFIFFNRCIYVFNLSFFSGIVDIQLSIELIPLIVILPLEFYWNKLFVKSKEETYRKVVFYFLNNYFNYWNFKNYKIFKKKPPAISLLRVLKLRF